MRISDWSSDVCSSDLLSLRAEDGAAHSRLAVGPSRDGVRRPDLRRRPDRQLHEPRHRRDGRNAAPRGSLWVPVRRSEEHTSELQSLMRISYAVFCLKKKKEKQYTYLYD